jgi:3-keto-5-aminohexanoate cleavage enzyme
MKPIIMVAPNGARLQKTDHPAVPITPTEVAEAVAESHKAGAQAAHIHVRDDNGRHCLDAGRYKQTIDFIRQKAGDEIIIQITTEAVGQFTPDQQRQVVRDVNPQAASVAFRELYPEGDIEEEKKTHDFVLECQGRNIALQWIIYSEQQLKEAHAAWTQGLLGQGAPHMLYVLGRYDDGPPSTIKTLDTIIETFGIMSEWKRNQLMVCAFGQAETDILAHAINHHGIHTRIGFENNRFNRNGEVAKDNAERVAELITKIIKPQATTAEIKQGWQIR